jgi:hypothetical protein
MRHIKVSGPLGFALVCLSLSASVSSRQGLQAQTQTAPAAGTTVVVRMMDAVDSGSDPAGKQYRASVTKPVNADNGVTIAQGAAATVTLANNGSGSAAQLSSVVINGQVVAVTTSSASVTSAAQSAAGNAVSAVGSILGHHTNVPSGVSAAAAGQRVVLPPGTTLSFVLAATASASPPAAAANSTPVAASAARAANTALRPAAALASGQGSWYQCRSWGENGTHETVYVTPFIHTDAAAGTIQQAYYTYMHATYPVDKLVRESDFCRAQSADPGQQAFSLSSQEKQWASSNPPWEVIHINWTYTPAEVAATNAKVASASTAAAASAAAVAPPASANEYYVVCASGRAGPAVYYSDIFAAAPLPGTQPTRTKSGPLVMFPTGFFQAPFFAFLQKKYGFKSDSNYPVECGANFAPTTAGFQNAQRYKESLQDLAKQNKAQIVETGWKNQ